MIRDYAASWKQHRFKTWLDELILLNCVQKTLENQLNSKEMKPVTPKEYQPWIFIGRTDAEVEVPIHCPPNGKSQLIGKDPDAGEDWRQKKRMTEDEMAGWHHWLSGHEFEQTPGETEGQESLKDRRAWCAAVQGITKNQTWLSD